MSASKSVLIVGATGGTGIEVVRRAIADLPAADFQLHVLVRSAEKMSKLLQEHNLPADRLTAHVGSATDQAAVERVLVDSRASVVVLAVGTSDITANSICFDTAVTLVRSAAKLFHTGRIGKVRAIAVSGGGLVGHPGALMEYVIVPWFLKEPAIDAIQMEAALKEAPPEVMSATIIRPYKLTEGPATTTWRVVDELYPTPYLIRRTSRKDVAACVVKEIVERKLEGRLVNVFTDGW